MKTWEAFKYLEQDKTLKFKSKQNDSQIFCDKHGIVRLCSGVLATICINDEWELVKEPVNFITAVKAYGEGHKIKCIINDKTYVYNNSTIYVYNNSITKLTNVCLVDDNDIPVSTEDILEGKWYIED